MTKVVLIVVLGFLPITKAPVLQHIEMTLVQCREAVKELRSHNIKAECV